VTPRACGELYQGTGASGDPCFTDHECTSGFCTGGGDTSTCIAGQCVGNTPPNTGPFQIGEDCFSFGACVPGAYCDTVTSLCTPLKSSGAACTQNEECGYGLACVGTTGARTCGTLPAVGQSCAAEG